MPPLAGRYSAGLLPKLPDVSAVRRSWRNKKRYNGNFRLNLRLTIHEPRLSYRVPINFAFVLIGVSEIFIVFFKIVILITLGTMQALFIFLQVNY
jgi:hypothetical protein